MWNIIRNSGSSSSLGEVKPSSNRKGWKTIRVFVSSTVPNIELERDVLEKQVFPDLRLWCEPRKLRLVECDLKWGLPDDSISEEVTKTCLSEVDRCYEENTTPFFLNISEKGTDLEDKSKYLDNIAAQYQHIYALSDSEANTVKTALRNFKNNSLFLMRDILVSEECTDTTITTTSNTLNKDTNESIVSYTIRCGDELQLIAGGLSSLDSAFSDAILPFFQGRISELYPLDQSPLDMMEVQKGAHSNFLDSRSSCVLGRDKMITQIENYIIHGSQTNAPLLVVGIAGAGKSALMAKCAYNATLLADQGSIKIADNPTAQVKVFYHFVGATPRSTDLASFLQRLTKEMKSDMLETQTSLDSLINLAYNLLESPTIDPIVIFVDAINQMDEDKHQYLRRWIPETLSSNVRLVISTIESTVSHQTIRSFKTSPTEIICGPLDKDSRKAIVTNILRVYNKRLDDDQMKTLLDKMGSQYPLWLTLVCEELRVHGIQESLIQKIEELPDGLISLEESVFARFEGETGGNLMKACVCLLEVSRHGLLETELLTLLGEESAVTMPEYTGEAVLQFTEKHEVVNAEIADNIADTKQNISRLVQETYLHDKDMVGDQKESQHTPKCKNKRRLFKELPAKNWAGIYRKLKPLLRPCGDLGEGRLDFYHRSLSKAARKKYFSGDDGEKKHKYNFWHGVLADFFEGVDNMDRKAEELPYHLEKLLDNNRLISCLMDWEVFDRIYNEDFSIDLLHSWRQCGGYGVATAVYREQLSILRKSDMSLIDFVLIVEKVYSFLIQAGQYAEALELMEERLSDELEKLGERPEEMADIYQNMARCKSEIDKAQQFVDLDQLDDNQLIVKYGQKCLQYRKQLSGVDNDYRCALANILIAHHLSNVADLTGEAGSREEAFVAIENATQVFTQLGDIGHIAECLMTKAIIDYSMPFPEREKLLLRSLDLCLKGYGENHLLTTRIYLNTGIAYEMARDTETAYEFFLKLRKTCLHVFGPGHPKTMRAMNTLEEPRYVRMKAERQRRVPETA